LPQITETLKNIGIIFREVWEGIWAFLKPLVMDIVNFFRNNWDTIKTIISAAWDII
jgi:phage-related protein